jgi:hypothetical protein
MKHLIFEKTYGDHLELKEIVKQLADDFYNFFKHNIKVEIVNDDSYQENYCNLLWTMEDDTKTEVNIERNKNEWAGKVYKVK